jgi:hypothetical protein
VLAAAIVVVVAGVAAALIAFDRNSAPSISTPVTKGQPQMPPKQPKNVRFTKSEEATVLPVAREFLFEAVARHNMHRAWNISAPELRVDTSRSDWDRGENTIITPYPLHHARWELDYSYKNRVGLQVAVFPKKQAKIGAMVFYMELKRATAHAKWLVDQWLPSPGSEYIASGNTDPLIADRSVGPPPGLSALWLALPLGVILTILGIPVGLGIRELRRNRRARRTYEATLPELSHYRST